MSQETVDLLINARWIIPVIPENVVYSDCSLVVDGSKIKGLYPKIEAKRLFTARQEINLDNHVLMPGLVNAHGHLAMTLLRGYADDLPLDRWLEDHIWPAEARWVSEEFVRDGAELAMAEMLKSGTTCFSDMYFFPDQVALVAREHGLRCQLAFPILNFASAWARDGDEYISKGLQLRDTCKGDELINVVFGPHAPYTVDDRYLERVATYANELDICVQIHLHETQGEVDDAVALSGERPIARLQRLGLLTPNTQCVHMTALNDDDIRMITESRSQVIHCPKSNLKLASGFCPVKTLQDAGINVALGTDGAASNNSLDMFSEMQFASLLAKGVSGDASALDTHATLRMATLNGARALGLDGLIGSLEAGKSADIVALDMGGITTEPMYNPLSQLVYTAMGERVSHVWINGAAKLADRQLTTFNEQQLGAKARQWRDLIQA
ncbi:MAG: N-ethylammeline chlorohydrolase [Gammaproteobacteria bacterium BRH_c0]|nr:MAG: N-ethylammeline chlorohydrolase [Gammaproteobacteria bacterium BRH_c0]